MRNHAFPTVILLLTVSIALSAETVMIAISEAESSDYFRLSGYGCAEAMEGGAMAEFFDLGHIVFNYGIPGVPPEETPFTADRAPVRVAKSGGARQLMEIELHQPSARVPQRVIFTYTDIFTETTISAGSVRLVELGARVLSDASELCAAYGRAIARHALEG